MKNSLKNNYFAVFTVKDNKVSGIDLQRKSILSHLSCQNPKGLWQRRNGY
ncbi:MAG: hypothetical protein K2N63_01970 [Lachnospiraceae bacterium]|nr:hypothetical protein [Lachnospiraceae bacterium]